MNGIEREERDNKLYTCCVLPTILCRGVGQKYTLFCTDLHNLVAQSTMLILHKVNRCILYSRATPCYLHIIITWIDRCSLSITCYTANQICIKKILNAVRHGSQKAMI